MNNFKATAAFVSLFAVAFAAHASKSMTSGDEPTSRGASNTLKFATGPAGKGYSKLFADLKDVCGPQVVGTEIKTQGGLDNLNVLSNKKADVGIAQLDTIKDLANGDESINSLKAVAVLNYNYLHVLTAAAGYSYDQGREWYGAKKAPVIIRVSKFSDLKGKTVALVGSAQLMAQVLQQRVLKDYNMRFVNAASDAEAAKLVLSGQVQAMMTVGGAPHGYVDGLSLTNNLALLPFDEDVGGIYSVRKIKYTKINANGVKILAIPNVLIARDFNGKKAEQVSALGQCLAAKLEDLKEGEYEPGWNEIKAGVEVDLPKFRK